MRVWMDQGGTFTDVLRVGEDGRVRLSKVLSDRADLAGLGAGAEEVRRGSTVATNALLEGRGAPTLLIISAGFGDLPEIGDGTRPELFSLRLRRPLPLCAAVLEVEGRIGADGALLSPHRLDLAALRAHREAGIAAAAVVLVHGPLRPEEEERLGALCREAGFGQVSLGSRVAPSRGLLWRVQTTLADAALSPLLPRAPGLYMRSDGGLARAEEWSGKDAVLSGPAGGVVATAALAARLGSRAFGLDMGGTSTDVCRVDGEPERTDHLRIAGLTLRVPAVRLETVSAGGGSILGLRGGIYEVGPRSAGADPGPASYGRGGPATLTDAEVALGRLPVFPAVCGPGRDQPLDVDAARAALARLDPARPVEQVATGMREVADELMARAVRQLAARLGVDPAGHALVAFGGAGPAHATAIARRLGVRVVAVPRLASAFSALGVGMASRRAERVAPVLGSLSGAREALLSSLPFEGRVSLRLALRYRGTSTVLELPAPPELPDSAEPDEALITAFHAEHRARYGFSRPGAHVEVTELRASVTALDARPAPIFDEPEPELPGPTTRAFFEGWREVPLLRLSESDGAVGPALLVGAGTTVVLEPGWRASLEGDHLRLVDEGRPPSRVGLAFDPVHTAVMAARLMAIAEQMGEQLGRLARSVSIRERLDFSCALFDARGRLMVNAPHVPVHLGAMGETVRDLLARRGDRLAPGQVWASNDPYAGGSHLPDITVLAPVFRAGRLRGFVGCRGHHVDVGGITPGSMPPFAATLEEEGLVLRQVLLAEGGRLIPPPLPGCREPETVLADLEAQVAATALGLGAWERLAEEVGDEALDAQLGHLFAVSAEATRAVLRRLPDGVFEATETLDGVLLRVRWEIAGDRARLVVRAPAHPGNLNAPRAVAVAALLYAIRALSDEEIPLNEGALEPLTLDLEPGGLCDPRPPAAVAGGNVETSQRLVDALLAAVGALAPSQGTMNNLTVGTSRGAWYETIGGGGGAGPGFAGGTSQIHMTNTRATDVEELERRFPVRVRRLALRRGSGGAGRWRGGDGLHKEWVFLEPAQVSLLAGRRDAGAPGLAGGGAGAPGRDERDLGQGWEPAPPSWRAEAGDALRVLTPGGGGYGSAAPCGAESGASIDPRGP